jgi:spermidine synthase
VLLLTKNTRYGTYQVEDKIYSGRRARILYSSKTRTEQSAMPLDDDTTMLFPYNQRFMEIVLQLKARQILIIGGGVYTLPTAINLSAPTSNIDIVEPNEELDDIAIKYFNFRPNNKTAIYHQDGISFLKKNSIIYDLIIIDAYNEDKIPVDLLTNELPELIEKSLNKTGLVAMNIISPLRTGSIVHSSEANFSKVFKRVTIYPADNQRPNYYYDQNLVLIASNKDTILKLKYNPIVTSL